MNTYNTCHVDNATTTLTHHYWYTSVNEVEGTLKVYCDNSIPLLLCHTKHKTIFRNTSIVNEDINRTEFLFNLLYNLFRLCEVCRITCIPLSFYTKSSNLSLSSFAILINNKVCECNVCTLLCKLQCDSLTNTTCSTCNKGCLTFQ